MARPPAFAAIVLAAGLALGAAARAAGDDREPELWAELQAAAWPAEVVRLADEYLRRYPQGAHAGGAAAQRDAAREASLVLMRHDVRLYRSAFDARAEALHAAVQRAGRGDKEAALLLARAYQRGNADLAADPNRYEGWLQYAAMLGNDSASYELALHYRRIGQPVLASKYEARAAELGFVAPRALDHNRK